MIYNIVDKRTNPHHWKHVTVVIEPTWHDNTCKGADKADRSKDEGLGYIEMADTSVKDAIFAAWKLPFQSTLYLYDLGEGIREVKVR